MEELSETEELVCRNYQSQLEEIAAKKNTIIHLPTGSGKTFIAVRLITRFRDALQKPWGEGGKRTFFLVNTVPLVYQQKEVIIKLSPVKSVGSYSSEDKVDYWDKRKWDAELTKNQVIVMTSQILSDMITHGYIRVQDINLIIFDECHHAVNDHPMRDIMKQFENCPLEEQPRVLGLTATLLNANVKLKNVPDTLRTLETTFHGTIATVSELGEVLSYSTNPHETIKFYSAPKPTEAAKEAIKILDELIDLVLTVQLPPTREALVNLERGQKDITTDPHKIVKAVKNMIVGMIDLICELGVYGGALGVLAYIILLERLKRKAQTKEEGLLYVTAISHATHARAILLYSMEQDTGYEKIVKHSSEKVIILLNILKEYNPSVINTPGVLLKTNLAKKHLSGIIFTQQRFTSKILYNLLKEVKNVNPEEFDFLKHDFIVGFNVNPCKNTREQHFRKKSSQKALLRFSNGELNCLISTSVIEEGVDIPQCMLVVRFDQPLEYRSYMQSKGRARSSKSSFVIMVDKENTQKFLNLYKDFQNTENFIKNMLVGDQDRRDQPSEMQIEENLYKSENIPPFCTQHGNRLSAAAAVSLLNRYCSILPHDQFTIITPMWIQETVLNKYHQEQTVVTIIMPIACSIKEKIVGDPQFSLKSAKRSTALKACIKLYKEGELDEYTLLPRHFAEVNFEMPDIKECFPNWPWDVDENRGLSDIPRPGTKKRMRKHEKVFPSNLRGPENWSYGLNNYYLHIIKLKTRFDEPKDPRERILYDFLQRNNGFAFVTPKPLPKLCDFPMFLTVGEVATHIEVNYAVVPLDLSLFKMVKQFHYFIFNDVLEIAKKFLVFDGTDGQNCMYVVPVHSESGDNDFDIDWELMKQYHNECIPPFAVPSYEERKSKIVTVETYKEHVVTPWYRSSILPDRYIVSNVLEYMTPRSHFDTDSYGTYADYYMSKYNLEITGPMDQPLLEVRNISSRMNCLLPRAATIKEFSDKQQKLISLAQGDDKPNNFTEILIPEFCIKYDFPGVLWYKAILLPSILHRVFMLLVASELRAEIARATNYGVEYLPKSGQWEPIEVNLSIAMKSLRSQTEETPAPINTIDRINNPIDEAQQPPVKMLSMKDTIYQLQLKKLDKDYLWDEKMEPIDIERNISTATVMDVECYDEFVTTLMTSRSNDQKDLPPPPQIPSTSAICPPPLLYNDKIKLLQKNLANRGPELKDVLAALTTIESNDTFNLERTETLGDSFLKFAATLYLYHKFPKLNEGQLTNIKGRLIGNRNLFYAGERVKLGGRMKIEQFSPKKDMLLPGFFAPRRLQDLIEAQQIRPTFLIGMQFSHEEALSGELTEESWQAVLSRYENCDGAAEKEPLGQTQNSMQTYIRAQAVSDKSVADCVEALIGTYLLSGGVLGAVKILEWFRILPANDKFAEYLHKSTPTVIKEGKASVEQLDYLLNGFTKDIQEILNYTFKDVSFLLEALSHPSYIRNRYTRSYERLEFLGDAILDFLITSHIFENSRELKPGELTDLRSALVNNVTFASYVVKLGLHKYLLSQLNPNLDKAIMTFVEHQEHRNHCILQDVLYLIDEEDCHIAEYVDVPKVLSDIFESLIGAIYLDTNGDLQAVWSVVYRIMWKEIDSFSQSIPQQPVKMLYERIHACPVFGTPKLMESEIPKVSQPVTITKNGRQITVYGFGGNKFQAKRAAAKLALKVLSL